MPTCLIGAVFLSRSVVTQHGAGYLRVRDDKEMLSVIYSYLADNNNDFYDYHNIVLRRILHELCLCTQVSEVTQIEPQHLQFAKVCDFCTLVKGKKSEHLYSTLHATNHSKVLSHGSHSF